MTAGHFDVSGILETWKLHEVKATAIILARPATAFKFAIRNPHSDIPSDLPPVGSHFRISTNILLFRLMFW
jgi:hypothetical protein